MSERATPEHLLQFLLAYCRLLAACYEAKGHGLAPADAPVECRRLLRIGIGADVLLWMLYQGHADHFGEDSQAGERTAWRPRPSALVRNGSALALTPLGQAFGELLVGKILLPEEDEELQWAWGLLRVGALTPRYDKENRLFTWGRHLLKSYRQPSANQELILVAAEELEWAGWFDDPLPRRGKGNPKGRLHDAIKNLNRHQSPYLVRFKGDGTGMRVGWELR
jgi:hypothetical protein